MENDCAPEVLGAARRAADAAGEPLLLAVSGGLDSMVLLHAMCATARDRVAAVATFDHGTGRAASRAVRLTCAVAASHALPVVVGSADARGRAVDGREASWRSARHEFLFASAARIGARVAIAHTEDDQIETTLMRIMRGSGTRGLAGLYAESPIVRPFLRVRRHSLSSYARCTGVQWIEDPSNASMEFFRNRVRRELLPALRGVEPDVDEWLLSLAQRASGLRMEIDAHVTAHLQPKVRPGSVRVASTELTGYAKDSLAMLWSSLASRAGLALDRRGTERIAAFTMSKAIDGAIPLSGGWSLEATREAYILRRVAPQAAAPARLPEAGVMEWGSFRFRVSSEVTPTSAWSASIAGGQPGLVRAWGAGDRLEPAAGQPRRRVTRYLSDVGMHGAERAGWPVVVAGDDVVWIPGVRRSDAATDRSGRPVRHYVCERIDR